MTKVELWPRMLQKLRELGYSIKPVSSDSSAAGFDLFYVDLSHWRLRFSALTPVISITASHLYDLDADELADTLTDLARRRDWRNRECVVLLSTSGTELKQRLRRRSAPVFLVCDRDDQKRIADATSPTHALLDLVSAQLPLSTLAPYEVSGRLVEGAFFGREAELGRVLRHPEASFAIVGIRRVGKTWFLQEVKSRLAAAGEVQTQLMYFDTSTFQTVEDMFRTIVRQLDFREFNRIEQHPKSYPFDYLNFLRLTSKRLGGPITFFFDEADKLLELSKSDPELLRIIRASTSAGYCRYLLAGFAQLLREICDRESPLYFGLALIELKAFSRRETGDMVVIPMESLRIHLKDSEEIVSRIHAETRGLPLFVQFYCNELISQMEHRGDRTLSPQDVESIHLSQRFKVLVVNTFRDNVPIKDKVLVWAVLAAYRETRSALSQKDSRQGSRAAHRPLDDHWIRGRSRATELYRRPDDVSTMAALGARFDDSCTPLRHPGDTVMTPIKIMVVDNEPVYRDVMIEAALRPSGFEVVAVGNAGEAREVLKRELIHVAIVDIRLLTQDDPNDTSGLDLCREMDPTIGRIVWTAFKDARAVREALLREEGREPLANGFLFKDEDAASVLREVRRVLAEQFEVIPRDRFAVLTSGGDSPGMNAAIWGVVRTAMANEIEVLGVENGYRGLTEGRIRKLSWNSIDEVLTQGGTVLRSARFDDFKRADVRERAAANLVQRHVSGLVVIGGDGSMRGASALARNVSEAGGSLRTIAIPGTIDNDLAGTEMSLGAASAANAIADELSKLIPPAQALRRIFVVEVMGRHSGFLALEAALAAGADALVIPETLLQMHPDTPQENWRDWVDRNETESRLRERLNQIAKQLDKSFALGKRHALVLVSEGIGLLLSTPEEKFDAKNIVARHLKDEITAWSHDNKPDVRVQELGYPVRGADPCRFDMILGAELGARAVTSLIAGRTEVMLGWSRGDGVIETGFSEVARLSNRPPNDIWADRPRWRELLDLHEVLIRPPGQALGLRQAGNIFLADNS